MKRRRLFLEKGIAFLAAAGCLTTWVNHLFALIGHNAESPAEPG